jgi:hypothetical protein
VGYLIKARFSKRRKRDKGTIGRRRTRDLVGLDIYRLAHGTTVADALDPANERAEFAQYTRGGKDVDVVITPEDLGIAPLGWFAAWRLGSYVLKASRIFESVDAEHKALQAEGLA